jgi:Uma2 family endonuclease
MLRTRKTRFTPAEYLAMEEVADYKSEFYSGEIFALSGGSADHSLIAGNQIYELNRLLGAKPCRVFNSDMRLHIRRSGLYTYPDVMVVCGKLQFVERRNDTLLNPLLIIEVLSETTRDYDRGAKFNFYKGIPSLQEVVLVESESARVECYHRAEGDKWTIDAYDGLDAVARFESVDCDLPLRSIYLKVSWLD